VETFGIRGGPHAGAEHPDGGAQLETAARRVGARFLSHTADGIGFVVDAASAPDAMAVATEVFRPVFGDRWWAEVASTGYLN